MGDRAYGGHILEHFRRPRNRGRLAAPDAADEGVNPLCGDRVRIEVVLRGERIEQARFTADACAICIASASLLTERVAGMAVGDAAALDDDAAVAQLGTEIPPTRRSCAVLPLETLRRALRRRALHGLHPT